MNPRAVLTKTLRKGSAAFGRLASCFWRYKIRRRDGKEDRCWSVIYDHQVSGARAVQRDVLDPAAIKRAAWRQTIESLDQGGQTGKQIMLFAGGRAAPSLEFDVMPVRFSRLRRGRRGSAACILL